MVSALSKRQAQRNEQALQDLLKNVPGNNECADCRARNPGWASWNLGIFLCLRCATLHRKLGTHISKVKSISMDQWGNEHIEPMKRNGNAESNRKHNPNNVRPDIPIDVDEVNGAMERFIRQKYEKKVLADASRPGTRQNTGSTSSVEDKPPPLPPKPTNRFGLGLRSSSYNLPSSQSSSRHDTPPSSRDIALAPRESSPPRVSKASKVFGSDVNTSADPFEHKMLALRNRGFTDDKRNATVLRSMDGNLERSIDVLQRLSPNTQKSPPERTGNVNGISVQKSTDPFQMLDNPSAQPAQQQQQQQQTFYQSQQAPPVESRYAPSPTNSTNPFLQNYQPAQSLEQTMQNLNIAQSQPQQTQQQQPLFPHNTGGYSQPNLYQSNPFLNSFTPPPMPQIPPQYSQFMPQQASSGHQQSQSATETQPPGGNPFLRSSQSQYFTHSTNPFNSNPTSPLHSQPQSMNWPSSTQKTSAPFYQNNFAPVNTQSPNPFLNHHQQQQQQHQQQQQRSYTQPALQHTIPFQPTFAQEQNAFSQQPQYIANHQQTPQFPQRTDTTSILALYNQYPVTPTPQTSNPGTPGEPTMVPRRVATMPAALSNPVPSQLEQPSAPPAAGPSHINPFAANRGAAALRGGPKAADPSRESVDFATLMAGRHSPDAFSGLSARFV